MDLTAATPHFTSPNAKEGREGDASRALARSIHNSLTSSGYRCANLWAMFCDKDVNDGIPVGIRFSTLRQTRGICKMEYGNGYIIREWCDKRVSFSDWHVIETVGIGVDAQSRNLPVSPKCWADTARMSLIQEMAGMMIS